MLHLALIVAIADIFLHRVDQSNRLFFPSIHLCRFFFQHEFLMVSQMD